MTALEQFRANTARRTLENLAAQRRRVIISGSTDRMVVETHGAGEEA